MLVVAVSLLIALMTWVLAGIATYQPFGGSWGYGAGYPSFPGKTVTTHNFGTEHVFGFTSGKEVRYRFMLHNEGRFTVTVSAIRPRMMRIFDRFEVFYQPNEREIGMDNPRPLRNLVLERGESRYIEMRYRFMQCMPPARQQNTSVAWNWEQIDFKVLGISRSVTWQLPYGIAIKGICLE